MALTPRSTPRPDCAHCKGSGIISICKDPDEIADCVCTDPVEAVVEFAEAALEVELLPWQRRVMERALPGDQIAVRRGRHG